MAATLTRCERRQSVVFSRHFSRSVSGPNCTHCGYENAAWYLEASELTLPSQWLLALHALLAADSLSVAAGVFFIHWLSGACLYGVMMRPH